MRTLYLSPSRLSLFTDCPRCFWLDVKGIRKRPTGIFPSLPSGMDSILKKYFDTFRCKDCLPPELEGKLEGKLFGDIGKLDVWRNCFKGLEYFDGKSGIGLRGALDDLFVTGDGFHVPLDFKTRGYPLKEDTHEHYQDQMNIYSFLLEENGMKTNGTAVLLFYYPDRVDGEGIVKFIHEIVKVETVRENGKKLFMDAVGCLVGEEPECSGECCWCNWNK